MSWPSAKDQPTIQWEGPGLHVTNLKRRIGAPHLGTDVPPLPRVSSCPLTRSLYISLCMDGGSLQGNIWTRGKGRNDKIIAGRSLRKRLISLSWRNNLSPPSPPPLIVDLNHAEWCQWENMTVHWLTPSPHKMSSGFSVNPRKMNLVKKRLLAL